MASRRRSRGIAALSAGALATAALTSGVMAAEDCNDDGCAGQGVSLAELVQAFSGEEIPEDALKQMEAFYQAMGVDIPADAFIKMSDALPENAMFKVLELYEQMGVDIPPEVLAGLAEMDELFFKVQDVAPEDAMPKVEFDVSALPNAALMDIDDALPLIEEALGKLGDGQIDAATVQAILDMLPQDE